VRIRFSASLASVAPALSVAALALALLGCSSGEPMADEEGTIGQTAEPLTAQCKANVTGKGLLDTETVYLPNVVHCENGGAPLEALKAQAIAARTFLYYKLETAGAIGDGQGDQVYSCGSAANALQKQAVLDTAGMVLRYKSQTIASFYVAGGAASPPMCKGGSASTEPYVTYNEGLTGSALHQTTLGYVSPSNYRNRGCMSQLGSRCLADEGKTYEEILKFYYGADIVLEQATGPCVPTAPPGNADGGVQADAGDGQGADPASGADPADPASSADGDDAGDAGSRGLYAAPLRGDLPDTGVACGVSRASHARGGGTFAALFALAAIASVRRRRVRARVRVRRARRRPSA
jgi:MYXO-CTERM domain-containing protein